MILLLDTSTPECKLTLVDGEARYEYAWQADRELARGLLEFLVAKLAEHEQTLVTWTVSACSVAWEASLACVSASPPSTLSPTVSTFLSWAHWVSNGETAHWPGLLPAKTTRSYCQNTAVRRIITTPRK